jgi:hypothetical protein
MPMPLSLFRLVSYVPTAGAALLALMIVGVPGQARAGSESAQPYCWGPSNSPADCPDYSLMNPYAYGKYYDRTPTPYGYDSRHERSGAPGDDYGYGPSYGR